jgi:hypothetical protein
MRKLLSLVFLLAMVATLLPAWQGGAQSITTVLASGDAYADSANPRMVLGNRGRLRTDRSPARITYLRFPSGCAGKCTLSVYSDSVVSNGPRVYTTSNFSERTLTWENRPGRGTLVADFGAMKAGWNTVTLSSTSARVFRLDGDSATQLSIYSREGSGSRRAKLSMSGSPVTPPPTEVTQRGSTISLPARAAFYYPWFPEAWKQGGIYPYTKYEPTLGYYDGFRSSVISNHIDQMLYGGITVGISSWWGQGHWTDEKVPTMLEVADGTGFKWAFYYEKEGFGNPSQSQISSDIGYLVRRYGSSPNAASVRGKLVIFVYNAGDETCAVVDRWRAANAGRAFLVMKVFSGFRDCANQPDDWHQYAPLSRKQSHPPDSFAISPGFDQYGEPTRLARDKTLWASNVRNMVASGAKWQLITTFNEWGEGTGVESTREYSSSSGYGYYLDVLHVNGRGVTAASEEGTPTATATPSPEATTAASPIPSESPPPTEAALPDTTVAPTESPTESATEVPTVAPTETATESPTPTVTETALPEG